ncbi:Methylcrotonoyl-CoA carboxylase subunit alpha [Venturia nashicola]|uniref:Methylcrotonoyl-CoA carboxylase subunit alpha n=1 Tax=Venturia nashicola TaxID=86259 RepID=A0A4Z1PEB7_9PEZI|nr:Methylcrotonoyl-CoA carboxylase subunit alpha [Venturia nashicola]TLD36173.1 Methylcrotonoyl-CoA carboxylase subunit alpha [Venturia nashicola]
MDHFKHDIDFFKTIPWCRALIEDPHYAFTITFARQPKANQEDELLAKTLKTGSTIPTLVSYYKKPTSLTAPIEELRTLVSVGPGVNGWQDMLHGGIAATLLDELMGVLLHLNNDLLKERARAAGKVHEHTNTVTAELTIKYLKPVITPQTMLIRVWLVKMEGRKGWIDGAIEGANGNVMVKGSGFFIQLRPPKI